MYMLVSCSPEGERRGGGISGALYIKDRNLPLPLRMYFTYSNFSIFQKKKIFGLSFCPFVLHLHLHTQPQPQPII